MLKIIRRYNKCHYAECQVCCVLMLSAVILNIRILSVIIINFGILNVVILSFKYTEHTECHYSEFQQY